MGLVPDHPEGPVRRRSHDEAGLKISRRRAAAKARRLGLDRALSDRRTAALSAELGGPVLVGDYRAVLANFDRQRGAQDPWWDTLITDPPFGPRTHAGARTSAAIPEGARRKHGIAYQFWTPAMISEFVSWAVPRTRRWICAMTSHDLCPAWENEYEIAGWYPFAPIPIIVPGMGCRLQGDGPSNVTYYLMVARSRSREAMANPASNRTALWRTVPGYYMPSRGRKPKRPGKDGQGRDKPAELLARIVADYSNPGDLVCDPMAGYGSTLIAALRAGRRAIGSEIVARVAKVANREIWNAAPDGEQAQLAATERELAAELDSDSIEAGESEALIAAAHAAHRRRGRAAWTRRSTATVG